MRALRLVLVLVLCAAAVVVVLFGAPTVLAVLVVGTFLLLTPGLVLVELLAVRDGLLEVVVAMVAGPAFWGVLATAETFAHLWEPRISVLVVAGLLALTAAVLLSRLLRPRPVDQLDARHRFQAHPHDRIVFDESGRHKGAFPFPPK